MPPASFDTNSRASNSRCAIFKQQWSASGNERKYIRKAVDAKKEKGNNWTKNHLSRPTVDQVNGGNP